MQPYFVFCVLRSFQGSFLRIGMVLLDHEPRGFCGQIVLSDDLLKLWEALEAASNCKRDKLADAHEKVKQLAKFTSDVRDLITWIEVRLI